MEYPKLKERAKTAGALIGAILALTVFAAYSCIGKVTYFAFALSVGLLCAWESAELCNRSSEGPTRIRYLKTAGYFIAIAVPLIFTANLLLSPAVCGGLVGLKGLANAGFGTLIGFLFGIIVIVCFARDHIEDARTISADLFPTVLLVGFCGSVMTLLTLLPDSQNLVGWLLITVCVNDMAAYFVGLNLGGPKLAPVISPNKTISGSLGGIAAGTLVGMLFSSLLGDGNSNASLWSLCLIVVVAAQLGDLNKSYLKRMHKVKDSGNLLPGHGGILDRVDGILAGSAVLYFWLAL